MLINPNVFLSRISCITIGCLALAGYSPDATSWGANGHTAIGILAVEQLKPETLLLLEEIVSPLTRQAMAEVCNWPDVIRETEEGKWSEPLHYINIPRGEAVYTASRDCPEQPGPAERPTQHCITEAISFFAAGFGNPQASGEQRRQSFAWLCHLVGDLHQPLHAGYAHDRGGNDVNVVFNGEAMNLHHFWDFALIRQRAGSWQYLVGELGEFPPVQAASGWSPEMVDDWTNESHKLAGERLYPANPKIDATYADQSWELIQRQMRLAASRLALIINSELKP